jgi:hypothetical protein
MVNYDSWDTNGPRLDWERPMSRWLIRELTRDSLARWRVRGKYLVTEGLRSLSRRGYEARKHDFNRFREL